MATSAADQARQVRLFQRAADQRLGTAGFLYRNQIYLDAVYLAGYAVECALKSLILKRTSQRQFGAVRQKLTEVGAKGHDFEYRKSLLKARLGRAGAADRQVFKHLAEELKIVASWSTRLRYEVGPGDPNQAREFLRAVRANCDWCGRS